MLMPAAVWPFQKIKRRMQIPLYLPAAEPSETYHLTYRNRPSPAAIVAVVADPPRSSSRKWYHSNRKGVALEKAHMGETDAKRIALSDPRVSANFLADSAS